MGWFNCECGGKIRLDDDQGFIKQCDKKCSKWWEMGFFIDGGGAFEIEEITYNIARYKKKINQLQSAKDLPFRLKVMKRNLHEFLDRYGPVDVTGMVKTILNDMDLIWSEIDEKERVALKENLVKRGFLDEADQISRELMDERTDELSKVGNSGEYWRKILGKDAI